jgi:hypothetical protein
VKRFADCAVRLELCSPERTKTEAARTLSDETPKALIRLAIDGVAVKLSEYATRNGIKYRAAWNRYKAGKIEGAYLDDSGHVVVPDPLHALIGQAAAYARVCTHKQRDDLDRQVQRMTQFANAAGCRWWLLSRKSLRV